MARGSRKASSDCSFLNIYTTDIVSFEHDAPSSIDWPQARLTNSLPSVKANVVQPLRLS